MRAEYGWGWEDLHRARDGEYAERKAECGWGWEELHRARLGVRREEGGVWMGLGKRSPIVAQAQAAWDTRPTLRARNQHEDRLVCCRYVG